MAKVKSRWMLVDFAGRAICNSGMYLLLGQHGPVFAL
jgi:hypothetical protein